MNHCDFGIFLAYFQVIIGLQADEGLFEQVLRFLLQTYPGIASNTVRRPERQERKSIGAERWVVDLVSV